MQWPLAKGLSRCLNVFLFLLVGIVQHVISDESCLLQSAELRVRNRNLHQSQLKATHSCLDFIHIPKTGGTSLEVLGKSHGHAWGREDASITCHTKKQCPDRPPYAGLHGSNLSNCCTMSDGSICAAWHVPPSMDSKLAAKYGKCNTFCVVRDPADRFRSQHAYRGRECSTRSLKSAVQALFSMPAANEDCHFIPQIAYVGTKETGFFCDHVLKYENLDSDVRALMRQYGVNVSAIQHEKKVDCNAEFDEESLAILRKYYAADYEAFGYGSLLSKQQLNIEVPSQDRAQTRKNSEQPNASSNKRGRCALLFFGLLTEFRQLALPSILKHIKAPNHQCDVFLHTYNLTAVPSNPRSLEEGHVLIHPEAAYLLTDNVSMDTNETFWLERGDFVKRTEQHAFPGWGECCTSHINMIKQWHSIKRVWDMMVQGEASLRADGDDTYYEQIGLFRSDAYYAKEIDVFEHEAGIADFANYPINDRMFWGKRKYAETWADRFSFADEFEAKYMNADPERKGYHSESYLFHLLESHGVPFVKSPKACSWRIRSNMRVVANDCNIMRDLPSDEFVGSGSLKKEPYLQYLPSGSNIVDQKHEGRSIIWKVLLPGVCASASLNAAGYAKVVQMRSNAEMGCFVRRIAKSLGKEIKDDRQFFEQFLPHHSGTNSSRGFQSLIDALRVAPWIGNRPWSNRSRVCIGTTTALNFDKHRILDWIAYHKLLGVDCFLLILDPEKQDLTDRTVSSVRQNLLLNPMVTVVEAPFNHTIRDLALKRVPSDAKYLVAMDVDEYLVPKRSTLKHCNESSNHRTLIPEILAKHCRGCFGIYLNRYNYGTSGWDRQPPYEQSPEIAFFHMRENHAHKRGKFIVDVDEVLRYNLSFGDHGPLNFHSVDVPSHAVPMLEASDEILSINHYVTASSEECMNKALNGTHLRRDRWMDCKRNHDEIVDEVLVGWSECTRSSRNMIFPNA
eukprot:TRINITY_DN616_c0_g1_i3.p1 TRINITY_DN616_c0_g1~~TRINITY_DN616_c0_g1_i3.p1  ORF type:complete len:960 (+),score=90.58 TRINITY_DN616_c0_g1_i3:66-2945(+)